jgi:hypothetical protein
MAKFLTNLTNYKSEALVRIRIEREISLLEDRVYTIDNSDLKMHRNYRRVRILPLVDQLIKQLDQQINLATYSNRNFSNHTME